MTKRDIKAEHNYKKDKKGIVTKADALKNISEGLAKADKNKMNMK